MSKGRNFAGAALAVVTLGLGQPGAAAETAAIPGHRELINTLLADPVNGRWNAEWEKQLGELAGQGKISRPDLLVIFVPGFGYQSMPENGADLAGPRRSIEAVGLRTLLAPLANTGTVEMNAELLADCVRQATATEIWLVSASSGGPSTAEALSRLAAAGETARIKVWVNIGGLLHGTALADDGLSWPRSWLARVIFAVRGWNFATVASLSTGISRGRAAKWQWPAGVRIVNLVGIPLLAADVSARARDGFQRLNSLGPNDGPNLIADALVPGAPVLVLAGTDHFLGAPDIGRRTQALARLLVKGGAPPTVAPGR